MNGLFADDTATTDRVRRERRRTLNAMHNADSPGRLRALANPGWVMVTSPGIVARRVAAARRAYLKEEAAMAAAIARAGAYLRHWLADPARTKETGNV